MFFYLLFTGLSLNALLVALPYTLLNASAADMDKESVQILFTHDGMGELEPCGCRSNPLGGISRRSALTERLKKEVLHTFQVETGNSFFENTTTPDSLKKILGFQSEKIAESFRLFPLHLFVPGEKDFSLGLAHLRKLKKISKVPFLAANLTDTSGKIIFEEKKVDLIRKREILWIGLVGTDLQLPENVKVSDPLIKLKRILKAAKVDPRKTTVILLSELGMERDKQIAAEVPEISLILGSRDQAYTQNPVMVEKTMILQTSYRNQHLGRVLLNLETGELKSTMIPLDESLNSEAPKKALELISDWKTGVAKIQSSISALESSGHAKNGMRTFNQCISCHEGVFNFWRKTNHAISLHPLKEKNLISHPECLKCHTVSVESPAVLLMDGKKGDWSDNEALMNEIAKAEKMDSPIHLLRDSPPKPMAEALNEVEHVRGSVQCENCHTSASGNHPFTGIMKKEVSDSTCIKCHTRDRAPDWYDAKGLNQSLFAEKRKQVQCPRSEP